MVGGVGARELVVRERQHPRHVERDVAVADHDRPLAAEVEVEVAVVGVAVVPADELGRRPAAGQLLAGDAERSVGRRAGRVDDRVVVREQLLAADVAPELDVAEVAKARVRGGLLVDARDRLDLRMVRRDARAHEPPRRRQALEHVDLDAPLGVLQQMPGGIEAGRAGADHGDADGGLVGHRGSLRSSRVVGVVWIGVRAVGAARLERATPSV